MTCDLCAAFGNSPIIPTSKPLLCKFSLHSPALSRKFPLPPSLTQTSILYSFRIYTNLNTPPQCLRVTAPATASTGAFIQVRIASPSSRSDCRPLLYLPFTIYFNRLSSANILIVNPFSSHDEYSRQAIITYKIVTAITWLLAVVTSIYYTLEKPHEGVYHRRTIWGQNSYHKTPFTMNAIITSIYWCVL